MKRTFNLDEERIGILEDNLMNARFEKKGPRYIIKLGDMYLGCIEFHRLEGGVRYVINLDDNLKGIYGKILGNTLLKGVTKFEESLFFPLSFY